MASILLVEDERHLADGLQFNLEAEGHAADLVETGEDALAHVAQAPGRYDLVILDVMLPGIDGFAVAAELRRRGDFIPILMLTARGGAEDVLRGFEAGADDYIAKPFELPILLARLRGLLRRRDWLRQPPTPPPAGDVFAFAGRIVDFDKLELRVEDRMFRLTLMEANLLRYLIQHESRVVSRSSMLEEVWGVSESADTRAIDNFIVRLRRYLEQDPAHPRHLLTVRGVGYRFLANPSATPTD